jgi:hypothetical protein
MRELLLKQIALVFVSTWSSYRINYTICHSKGTLVSKDGKETTADSDCLTLNFWNHQGCVKSITIKFSSDLGWIVINDDYENKEFVNYCDRDLMVALTNSYKVDRFYGDIRVRKCLENVSYVINKYDKIKHFMENKYVVGSLDSVMNNIIDMAKFMYGELL